jgi:hypothetical protein
MKRNLWSERLEQVKQQERPEAVLLVAGSTELTRIAVAWSGTHVVRAKRLTTCRRDDEEGVWRWLWNNAEYSKAEFLSRIPVSGKNTEQKFSALIANRVLYPDGSVNSFVERYLREKVLGLFRVAHAARKKMPT